MRTASRESSVLEPQLFQKRLGPLSGQEIISLLTARPRGSHDGYPVPFRLPSA
jgi:hypothetical protein